ncbi:MAG: hypothetical protein D6797_00415 [Bdellovibrio sp.]|nr:MAG: hypothetical protein D6797_00415 [Bdellovibrio sp.]
MFMRLFLFSILSLGAAFNAYAQSNYLEETVALESIYEMRARSVLNTFLRPHEYSVVVSAEIQQDPEKLKKYREDLDLRYLPGMPVPIDPQMAPANNVLHELKSRVEVTVVLNSSVSPEKEALIKKVLTSKLHIDESMGDSISIQRANLPSGDTPEKPQLLPELSWKMWALIILLSLLALAGLILVMNRRAQSQEPLPASASTNAIPPAPKGSSEELVEEREEDEFKIIDRLNKSRDQIYHLAVEYPQICTKALLEYFQEGHEEEVALLFETLGWETSRQLFDTLSPRVWGQVGHIVRERREQPAIDTYERAVSGAYQFLLSKVLEEGTYGDEKNPFQFLFKMPEKDLIRLLEKERPKNIALISLFSSTEQISGLLDHLDSKVQEQVILEASRLRSLPEKVVNSLASSLLSRLKQESTNKELRPDGPSVAANLMKALSPEKEFEIFDHLLKNNPEEAERLRRIRVQFVDIVRYPEEIVSEALEAFDADFLVKVLKGADEEARSIYLSLLPPKKARIVESDLSSSVIHFTPREIAESKRRFVNEVEQVLKRKKISLQEIWKQIDQSSEDDVTSVDFVA